uniref:DHC_N1 domain-containing protein n=1 Tax=Trichobilharzia regenti TaxID=157069 RepID=A0AA85JQ60_TRIRE
PLNLVQFCAEINRNTRYNTILMSHITRCIFNVCKYTRCTLAKLIHCKEDELNWNSKEINQTKSMCETWDKGLEIKNDLENLRNQLMNFPKLIQCLRYRLASLILHKFQSSIQIYVHNNEKYMNTSQEEQDKEEENDSKLIDVNKDEETAQKNYRLVVHPVLLRQLEDSASQSCDSQQQIQLLLWPQPNTLINIFRLILEQLKQSLHLNKVISDEQLPQIYFNEDKDIENINEYIDNQIYADKLVETFYRNPHLTDINIQKHEIIIPWNIINPVQLEATNLYICDIVSQYLPTYEKFEKDLLPKYPPHVSQSLKVDWRRPELDLNISGYNFFPAIDNANQFGLYSLIEQQSEAMKLYESLLMPWSQTIHEKTNQIIQSMEWIISVNQTIGELSTLLNNERECFELYKYRGLFQTSVDWINKLVNFSKCRSLFNDTIKMNTNRFFIFIDFNPLSNLLYNEIIQKLYQLLMPFITNIHNSIASMNNHLDNLIQTNTNFQPDYDGFMQVVKYLDCVRIQHEDIFLRHDVLCCQVEFLQYFLKCLINCKELSEIQQINWSQYEQFIIKWKRFTNQNEWARKKFTRYHQDFYQWYNKKMKESLDEVKRLVYLLTSGKYSDITNDSISVLRDMKEPYYQLIKLETLIHQLVAQHRSVQNCQQYQESFNKECNNHKKMNKPVITTTIDKAMKCKKNKKNFIWEDNSDLISMDNEMKKANCRYDAWQLNRQIGEFKVELYKLTLDKIYLKGINEKFDKLLTTCNNLSHDDVIIQFNSKWLKHLKKIIKALYFITDTELIDSSPDYWNKCSGLLELPLTVKWENCTIECLMKEGDNNSSLLQRKNQLKETWKIFHYLKSAQECNTMLENQWSSLYIHFIHLMNPHKCSSKNVQCSMDSSSFGTLNQSISGRCSINTYNASSDIQFPWIILNITDLIEQLYHISVKLQSLLQSGLLYVTKTVKMKPISTSLSTSVVNEYMNENDSIVSARYSLKQLNQSITVLTCFKSIQDHWLYLHRLHSLKQTCEEVNSSGFISLTDKFIQMTNDLLTNNEIEIIRATDCSELEDIEKLKLAKMNLKLFISYVHIKWDSWFTLKSNFEESVAKFNKAAEEMCDTFPPFCLLTNMERMNL